MSEGPLHGISVLDLTRVVAGPYGTGLLADLGARVVKVERPVRGDEVRMLPDQVRGLSLTFNDVNRNKEGITLDLRTERGSELLLSLLPHFDVLSENFAAGTMERWGLGWPALSRANSRLIYLQLSGFGSDGPYAGRRSYDLVAQAMGGFMAMTGEAGTPPLKAGINLADYIGGLFLVVGVLAALRERDRSGQGQHVDISNQDALLTMLDAAVSWFRAGGDEPARSGNFHRRVAPFGAFEARDGWVTVAAATPRMFHKALTAIGRHDLMDDPAFVERVRRYQHRDEVNALFADWIAVHTCAEVEALCDAAALGFGRVQSIADLAKDPQLEHRGMHAEVEHPDGAGPVPTRGVPIRFMRTPGAIRHAAPDLGQHTERVLGDLLGLSPEQVAVLRDEGVV